MLRTSSRQTIAIYVGLILCTVVWGLSFTAVKSALIDFGPLTLNFYRFSMATFILAILMIVLKKPFFHRAWQGLILGGIMSIVYVVQTIGLKYTSASNSGFLTGLFVMWVPLISWLFFKLKLKRYQWLCLVFAISGLWLVTGGIHLFNRGDAMTILVSLVCAIQIIMNEVFLKTKSNLWSLCFTQFLVITVVTFFLVLMSNESMSVPTHLLQNPSLRWLVFLSIFPTVFTGLMQLAGQKHVSAFKSAMIFSLEPVFAAIFAWTIGNERFRMGNAMGGFLIVIAMVISEMPIGKKKIRF